MLKALAQSAAITFVMGAIFATGLLLDTKADTVEPAPAILTPPAASTAPACSCDVCECTNCNGNCEQPVVAEPEPVVEQPVVEQLAAAPATPQVIEYTAAGVKYRVTDGHVEVYATQCFDDNGDGRYDRCEPAAWRSWYDLPNDQRLKLYRGDNAAATKQQPPAYRERSRLMPRIQNSTPAPSYRRTGFFRRPRSATRSCSTCG